MSDSDTPSTGKPDSTPPASSEAPLKPYTVWHIPYERLSDQNIIKKYIEAPNQPTAKTKPSSTNSSIKSSDMSDTVEAIKKVLGLDKDARPLLNGDPTYELVKTTIDDYNHTHPQAPISMPILVLTGDNLSTAYLPATDILQISSDIKQLPPDELKAAIAHELGGHKANTIKNGHDLLLYDAQKHAQLVSPELYEACKAAGLSDADIEKALPSDANAMEAAGTEHMNPATQKATLNTADQQEWKDNPHEMFAINDKVASHPDCRIAVGKVHSSQEEALREIWLEANHLSRNEELLADQASAETYGQLVTAKMLFSAASHADLTPEQEAEHNHPSLKTRLNNLGCDVSQGKDGEDQLSCPATPKNQPPRSR